MTKTDQSRVKSFGDQAMEFANGTHVVVSAPPAQGKSLLAHLTDEEAAALNEWGAVQAGDPARGGAVDMMRWPGWQAVAERRANAGQRRASEAE